MQIAVATETPTTPARGTVLFVHGAWHGAWCWREHFLGAFAAAGYVASALDLRGHGDSPGRRRLRRTSISAYVADLAAVVAGLPEPPVLVGHSMGGYVVQRYLTRRRAPAAVLMAAVPPGGVLGTTLRVARRSPGAFLRANLTLSLEPIVRDRELATELLFRDTAVAAPYLDRLQDESFTAYLGMFLPVRTRRVADPVLVLGGEADTIVPPRAVAATARAYRTEPVLFPGMAHDMMLDPDWERVVAVILAWLERRNGERAAPPER